jgi:hypothetical protein
MKSQKRVRFEKVAAGRVDRIINLLSSLSKCSNQYNYDYDYYDVEKMFKEIKKAVSATEDSFKHKLDSRSAGKFKF